MKFVCRRCEEFMVYRELESVGQDSLGVTFGCPQCGASIAMVTNPGETQMVKALGVELGGRSKAAEPLELTRASLASAPVLPKAAAVSELKKSMGKCPFAGMVASMGAAQPAAQAPGVSWSAEASVRLERVPDFIRPMAKTAIEELARQQGKDVVDEALMDSAKSKFMGS